MAVLSKPHDRTCSCSVGYICNCHGLNKKSEGEKKRKYNWNGLSSENKREPSKLMRKRLDPVVAHPNILGRILKKPCCNHNCMNKLWQGAESSCSASEDLYGWTGIPKDGFGKKFLDSILEARQNVYKSGQYDSQIELKNLLNRDVHTEEVGKQTYKFYHRGILGSFPSVPPGIKVCFRFFSDYQ